MASVTIILPSSGVTAEATFVRLHHRTTIPHPSLGTLLSETVGQVLYLQFISFSLVIGEIVLHLTTGTK